MDTLNEIITLHKEIAALMWIIYYGVSGVWLKDERGDYRQRTEKFERRTKELEGGGQ